MAETAFDLAIIGSGLFSGLLAGLLARDHGKRVIRIGRQPSAQRLPRSLDLALLLATRPQSWAMLRRAEAETRALLAALGAADGLVEMHVAIKSDQPDTIEGLDHVAHMALGRGLILRRDEPTLLEFKNVALLRPAAIEAKLAAWLTSIGVTSVDADAARLGFLKTGVAQLEGIDAQQIVLADDDAVLALLPEAQRPAIVLTEPMTATLTAPARRLVAPVLLFPDRGVSLMQRPDGCILALVSGDRDVESRLASTIAGPFPLPRRAAARYRRIVTSDGAPLIGRLKPSKLFVAVGLGHAQPFLAPAIARLLAGERREDEKRWFADHDPLRLGAREAIADFVAEAVA